MTIHPDFVCWHDEDRLVRNIDAELDGVHEKKRDCRNRIIRFGWDYENPSKWIGHAPSWIPRAIEAKVYESASMPGVIANDSWTINEYLKGQLIYPHTDSPEFGDVAILSLLSDATMRFTSPTGEVRDLVLPRCSLAIMSGELRNSWLHETLPLGADRRISIVYRRRI